MSSVPTHSHGVLLSHTHQLPRRRDHHSALFVSTVAALGGLLFGYDTGVISGALLFIKSSFHLGSTGQGVVVSAVLVGAVLGAALATALGDRISRRTLIFASALVFILGSIIATVATSSAILITGRGILGIGIGLGHRRGGIGTQRCSRGRPTGLGKRLCRPGPGRPDIRDG